ncbi:MarR family winged helix-turn-helix transcriptional regulator [Chloroflexota bacterium]
MNEPIKQHALWQLLRRTTRAVGKARSIELEEVGISGQILTLLLNIVTIADLGKDAIPSNIAKSLFLEPHSVSQQITKMEKMGLVDKISDLKRKNLVRIDLTETGQEVLQKSIDRRHSTEKIISVLTEDERHQLWITLAKLRDAAVKELRIKNPIIYPPSDPSQM